VPASNPEVQDGLLTVRNSLEGDRIRVAIEGELDLSCAETAETALLSATADGKDVLVDLSGLEFIDSTGISLLVMTMRIKQTGLSFLPSASAEVQRLLSLTGLDERMKFADLEEAPA
jgi:anti-sigma B factor antagonist